MELIDVKIIKKPKAKAAAATSGIATGGNGYLPGASQREVERALTADRAKEADHAKNADRATLANRALEADHAASAKDLDEDSPVREEFLSRIADDIAAGLITFEQGLIAVGGAIFKNGAEFGDFISSLHLGTGAGVDKKGNAEFQSVRVRGFFEALEYIVNRLQAIEGDTVLTESDQITEVTDLGGGNYKLKLKEKWDGYFTAMTVDTVLRGIYNTMSRGGGDYYTSWMLVTSVDTAANELTVMLYGDDEVPGEKNFAPIAMMNIARWGHRTDERRQRCLYLSSTEGRIVNLVGVRQPLITAANYGSTFGRVPEFISKAFNFAEGQEGVYSKYLFVENLFHVDHLGVPLPTVRDRGLWTASADYYDGTALREATGDYEISDVWHSGRRWRCCKLATTAEPGATTTDWAYIEGLTMVSQKIEYALSLSGTVTPAESAWSETQPEPKPLMWLSNPDDADVQRRVGIGELYEELHSQGWRRRYRRHRRSAGRQRR